jgi:hypothetical protein
MIQGGYITSSALESDVSGLFLKRISTKLSDEKSDVKKRVSFWVGAFPF